MLTLCTFIYLLIACSASEIETEAINATVVPSTNNIKSNTLDNAFEVLDRSSNVTSTSISGSEVETISTTTTKSKFVLLLISKKLKSFAK